MRRAHHLGERNNNAKISDEDVDLMRELYEDDERPRYWTIDRLVEKFEIGRTQVINIVTYKQRSDKTGDP